MSDLDTDSKASGAEVAIVERDELGRIPFQKGNQLWRLRPYNPGPERIIKNPLELYKGILAYFEWLENNPLKEEVVGWYQGEATTTIVRKMRAATRQGCCSHMGIQYQLWGEWKKKRIDLQPVIEWAEQIMFEQKFTGAAAGLLNANLIARELGIAEQLESKTIAANVNLTLTTDDPVEGAKAYQRLIHGESE